MQKIKEEMFTPVKYRRKHETTSFTEVQLSTPVAPSAENGARVMCAEMFEV